MRENRNYRAATGASWGSGRQLALLACLALAGFGGTYALAGGSHAATAGTTTIPNPDPPPSTTTRRTPPPPPPPPPPSPPAPRAAFTPPRVKQRPHRRVHAKPKPKPAPKAAAVVSRSIPRRAAETLTPAAVPVATSRSTSSRLLIELIGLALSLLAVAGALVREERGGDLAGPVYTTAFSIGLGLAIALLVS